jgi:predicted transcriptional regulator
MFTLSTHAVGNLENEILQMLWTRGPMTVRDIYLIHPRDIAYTAVMTTADRLFEKGSCTRERVPGHRNKGIAYRCTPVITRVDILRQIVINACADLGATAEERQALSATLAA